MTLTSEYAWLYADYPFSNDPNSDWLHPDWWRPPTETQEKPHRPNHFYDEQRLLLGRTYRAGARVRLTVPAGAPAEWTVIDLLDYEKVARPKPSRGTRSRSPASAPIPSGSARLLPCLRCGDRLREAARRHGLDPQGYVQGHAAHRRRRRGRARRRQLALDRHRAGHAPPPTRRRIPSARRASPRGPTRSASTASGRSRAAATTSGSPTSRSSARSRSGSTPTRSTASAAH